MMAAIAATAAEVKELKARKKQQILDSGASMSLISDLSHLDPNTSFCRAEEPRGMETANQSVMAISGSGTISGLDGVDCEGAMCSLITVPQMCKSNSVAEIFDACGAVAVKLDNEGISTLNGFKETYLKKSTSSHCSLEL